MKKWAKLDENDVVVEIVLSFEDENEPGKPKIDTLSTQDLIEVTENSLEMTAAVGDTYLPKSNMFVSPQPFPSWSLNSITGEWEAPKKVPEKGNFFWDEEKEDWLNV